MHDKYAKISKEPKSVNLERQYSAEIEWTTKNQRFLVEFHSLFNYGWYVAAAAKKRKRYLQF